MKKKLVIIGVCIILAALLIAGCIYLFRSEETSAEASPVMVTQISDLMGISSSAQGLQNRYAGVVEPQKTLEIQLENGRMVSEIYVQEGQEVSEGDPLFQYDTDQEKLSLEQQKLELERLDNSIESQKQKIAELEEEKKKASSEMQLQYTMEIQDSTAALKQSEYERKLKAMEIEKTQKSIESSIVTSAMGGVVRAINENAGSGEMYDPYGNETSFMTILATGEYRVKGTINEQNMYQIYEEMPVLVRSRVQEDMVWTGRIVEIDMENPDKGNNNGMYYGGYVDEAVQSSKYPFYIVLDSYEGLMLGQHVYIEMATEGVQHTEGVWLYEGYLMADEEGNWSVWTAEKGKIQKRIVEIGQYDEMMGQYEIISGLSQEDAVAWPEEGIEAGAPVFGN